MKPKAVVSLLIEAGRRFGEDRAPRLSAALAFYTVLSLAPLLLVIVGIAGQVYGEEAVRGEIVAQIQDAVGREVAVLVENALRAAAIQADGWRMALIGIVGLLIGASTLFVHVKYALNDIWGIAPRRTGGGVIRAVLDFLVTRVLAAAALIGIGILLASLMLASAALEGLAVWFNHLLPMPAIFLRIGAIVLALGIATVLFAYIYRMLPDARMRWKDVWFGAIVTSLLFSLGKELIAIYLARGAVGSAYGAAGALVVLLVWIYYTALIFFFGAELTQAFAAHRGAAWEGRRGFHVADDALLMARERKPEAASAAPDPGSQEAPATADPAPGSDKPP